MFTSKEIRQQFIDFFISKGHTFVKSSSVVPKDDPTLLFTNAGMNQFKDFFLGKKEAEYPRAVNSQKCIRAGGKHNDLDEVGKDGYHHTFFEMLGNWSFGDYYKKEAITWAWELLTEVWKLPKDKLHATVHHTDDEAFELWKSETDINHAHITKHGDKDNFWEMGETGPCGPCSEIHLDRGIDFCNLRDHDNHTCQVNGDCHRYIELWNLVFMQFLRHEDRSLTPLKNKYVDTGAGFERLCQVLQGVKSNYETDLFMPIINIIERISNTPYREDTGIAHRVIADHIRTLCFAIADGGMPSNEGRGYVLRRILRRATRYGRNLNITDNFLYKLVDRVIFLMGGSYEELKSHSDLIKSIVKAEEERFNQTLDKGLLLFEQLTQKIDNNTISGLDAFTLYDTFGFPLDLTKILAEEKGLFIDETGFYTEMEKQKTRARKASNFKMDNEDLDWIRFREDTPTEFIGYNKQRCESKIIRYAMVNETEIRVVLDITTMYAESGGQVSDSGEIFNKKKTKMIIYDVKHEGDVYVHYGILQKGSIEDKTYTVVFKKNKRMKLQENHTATHLLHAALRKCLGKHVSQKGSYVDDESIRFDFSHFVPLKDEMLLKIEEQVNNYIRSNKLVIIKTIEYQKAIEEGAIALFTDKYDDFVRVVSIEDISTELCGGTHVYKTGYIGYFKIINEGSIASGIRRIEALTGEKAVKYAKIEEMLLAKIMDMLSTNKTDVLSTIENLLSENKAYQQKIEKMKSLTYPSIIEDLMKKAFCIKNVNVVYGLVSVENTNELKAMGDLLKEKIKSGIGVLVSELEDKVSIISVVTPDLTNTLSAGKIVSELALIVDGKGGGRPDMAMAGGKAVEKINDLLLQISKTIENSL